MEPFYTKDGKEVFTLNEMSEALKEMSEENYDHHVTPEKNDIAIWIKDIHNNKELADAIIKAPNKEVTTKLLDEITNSLKSEPSIESSEGSYDPITGFGKEDTNIHKTYEKPEEWDAVKKITPSNEKVINPAIQENNLIKSSEGNSEDDQENVNKQSIIPPPNPISHPIPDDVNPQESPNKKEKMILISIGLVIGIIIGILISLFLRLF